MYKFYVYHNSTFIHLRIIISKQVAGNVIQSRVVRSVLGGNSFHLK
jgi:hypothetical protein